MCRVAGMLLETIAQPVPSNFKNAVFSPSITSYYLQRTNLFFLGHVKPQLPPTQYYCTNLSYLYNLWPLVTTNMAQLEEKWIVSKLKKKRNRVEWFCCTVAWESWTRTWALFACWTCTHMGLAGSVNSRRAWLMCNFVSFFMFFFHVFYWGLMAIL